MQGQFHHLVREEDQRVRALPSLHIHACAHLSGHMELNGVGQHDDESVHGSCDIGYRVTFAVVVQEVTCVKRP